MSDGRESCQGRVVWLRAVCGGATKDGLRCFERWAVELQREVRRAASDGWMRRATSYKRRLWCFQGDWRHRKCRVCDVARLFDCVANYGLFTLGRAAAKEGDKEGRDESCCAKWVHPHGKGREESNISLTRSNDCQPDGLTHGNAWRPPSAALFENNP